MFILATTELHKVPATILSRCQRFSFRRISQEDIAARLQYVAYQENIDLDDGAARVLARLADGGMRDGLSLLDQCASATTGELTAERIYACLGIAGEQTCAEMMGYIADHNSAKALALFDRLYADGKDLGAMLDELCCLTRDLMVLKTAGSSGLTMLSGVAADEDAKALASRFSDGELMRIMTCLQQTVSGFTRSASRRMDAELCILTLCQPELSLDAQSLNARISRIEEKIKTGSFTVMATEAPPAAQPKSQDTPPAEDPVTTTEEPPAATVQDQAPVGFWVDLVGAIKGELKAPLSGFFAPTPNAPVQGIVQGNELILLCANAIPSFIVSPSPMRIATSSVALIFDSDNSAK